MRSRPESVWPEATTSPVRASPEAAAASMRPDEPGEEEVAGACAVCGVAAGNKCSGCKAVFYCGKEHQKAHWKIHSKGCKAYKLAEDSLLGRHYVATRRIEPGELVIREDTALLEAPQQATPPVCLGCYAVLQAASASPCPACGWPLCPSCKTHGPECDFTRRHRDGPVAITGFGIVHPTYRSIGVVRALALKECQPERYARFAALASNHDVQELNDETREIAAFVRRFFAKLDVDEDEVTKIAGILQTNAHEVPTTEPVHIAVYDVTSYLEHSCRANCSKSFTDSGGIVIRAATRIEKGEHVTICYTDPLWGTSNRRHHLSRTKFFDCTCQRCSDPTEFGSMFNAIRCTKSAECRGLMLPETFLVADTPTYRCNRCPSALDPEAVDGLLERIGRELATMRKDDVAVCRAFLSRQAGVLHDSHFYMTDARLALAQMLGQQTGGLPALDDEALSEKILACKKLEDLLKTIVPAENRVRGLVLFEMHAAVAEFGRRQDKEQFYNILQESKRLLKEAYQLLRYEPEILPEGKIARTALRNLNDMEIIITKLCQNTVMPL